MISDGASAYHVFKFALNVRTKKQSQHVANITLSKIN